MGILIDKSLFDDPRFLKLPAEIRWMYLSIAILNIDDQEFDLHNLLKISGHSEDEAKNAIALLIQEGLAKRFDQAIHLPDSDIHFAQIDPSLHQRIQKEIEKQKEELALIRDSAKRMAGDCMQKMMETEKKRQSLDRQEKEIILRESRLASKISNLEQSIELYQKKLADVKKEYYEAAPHKQMPLFDAESISGQTDTEIQLEKRQRMQEHKDRMSSPTLLVYAEEVFRYWQNVMNYGKLHFTTIRKKFVMERLHEGYTKDDIMDAIEGCSMSPFHMGKNEQNRPFNDLELICRSAEKMENFIKLKMHKKANAPVVKETNRPSVIESFRNQKTDDDLFDCEE